MPNFQPRTIERNSITREELRKEFQATPLLLIRGLKTQSAEELRALCGESDELLHWDFGPVMELREDPASPNYLFSSERVPFHWDGAFHKTPSYLVFNCIEAPEQNQGGETLFTNTELLLENAKPTEREAWTRTALKYSTKKLAHYGGSIETAMVDRHPRTRAPILRYAEPVVTEKNPVELEIQGPLAKHQSEFVDRMADLIRDERFCYSHQWQTGDLLIADNHSLIHGRNAFTAGGPRHLRRIQIL